MSYSGTSPSTRRDTALLLLAHVAFWTLAAIALLPGLDRFADMTELYAWGMAPQWGTYKHPPLLAWAVGAWFLVFPNRDGAFHLLAMANAALAIWLVGRFTREVLADGPDARRWALWAMVAAAFALPYGNLALKLNMNSVLLPLWPLVAWAWWRNVRRPAFAGAVGLGLAAALAMMGKYYSGVVLVSLLLASLASAPGRAWMRTPWPYVSVAVFALALAPHVAWVAQHDWVSFRYIEKHRADDGHGTLYMLKFSGITLGMWLLAALALGWAGRPWRIDASLERWRGALAVLALGPWALTIALGLSMDLQLTSPWALPLGFCFPALVLAWVRPQAEWPVMRRRVVALFIAFWLTAFCVAALNQWQLAHKGDPSYYLPRAELAHAIALGERIPAWVGADWQYATALSFYMPSHPHAIPGFPDDGPAAVHTPKDWRRSTGLLVCPRVATVAASYRDCAASARAWLNKHGMSFDNTHVRVQREGWRFPLAKPYDFDLLWVMPSAP